MRIRPTRHNECEITTDDGTRITVTVNAAQPEHRRYNPSGSLSEYGIFPECDAVPVAQTPRACTCHPDDRPDGPCRERYAASECQALAAQAQAANADDEVVFFDGVGAARSSIKSCRDGVQWIRVGDRVYWPLSDSDAKRLQSACCGNGSFDGPASPAGEGEEIMVNTSYGVFILPLQPSELSSGPRFVVHVPSIEAPTVKALMEALETCLEMEERPKVIELAKAALAAVQRPAAPSEEAAVFDANFLRHIASVCRATYDLCQPKPQRTPEDDREYNGGLCLSELANIADEIERRLAAPSGKAGDGCHCGTCTCDPNMTPAVRFDLSPAQQEGAIREHLIRLGWTPPDEHAVSQPAAPSETVNVVGMPEFNGLLDHIYEYGTAAEGVVEKANAFARAVIARYASQQSAAVDEAMVERIATLLYEEATAEPSGPDRDYYRGLARKVVALITKHQEPKP